MQETQETRVPSLSQEDPQGEEMATHSSILAWRIPWTEDGLLSMGSQRVRHAWAAMRAGTPLQPVKPTVLFSPWGPSVQWLQTAASSVVYAACCLYRLP